MEAKYIAASEAAKEAVWLKNFLMDLGVVPSAQSVVTLYIGFPYTSIYIGN